MRRGGAVAIVTALATALALGSVPDARSANGIKGQTLHVYAAASLSDALTEVGRAFERQRPGWAVRMNFAGSQQLATQIEQGAIADLFASADERWMAHAMDRRLVSGEPTVFARNRLVVIVPKSNPARIERLQHLGRVGVKLVLGADAVPVGRYGRTALRNLARDPAFESDFAERALRNVVSEEENVKSIAGKVQLGEADAGIVYRSDVTRALSRRVGVLEIPEGANVIASYPIARVANTRHPDVARAFMAFVRSPDGQRILERHGFLPVAAATPAAPAAR